jgi:hypothetical protein
LRGEHGFLCAFQPSFVHGSRRFQAVRIIGAPIAGQAAIDVDAAAGFAGFLIFTSLN